MDHSQLRHDITTAVRQALQTPFASLRDERLVARSDAMLAMLPGLSGAQPLTTAAFLQHYDATLHQELCGGAYLHADTTTVADQLLDITRAVLVTGAAEGMSIDTAVSVALVLHTRGLTQFCALPAKAA